MTDGRRIGVTRWADVPPEARDRYWSRIREAGGVIVDVDESAAGRTEELSRTLGGLLLTGGIDVDPACYGAERHVKVKETDRARDQLELGYLDAALRRDIPVLAICRGHQLLNVGFGGTLVQHIDSGEHRADFRTEGYPSRWHDVRIVSGSRLSLALGGATAVHTNSRHHQGVAVATLGKGLTPVAFASDPGGELVEATESSQHNWCISVQWHPERPEDEHPQFAPLMQELFAAFVKRCG